MFTTLRNLINTKKKLEIAEEELKLTLRALQKIQNNLKVESEIKDTIIANKLSYIKVLERKIRDRRNILKPDNKKKANNKKKPNG